MKRSLDVSSLTAEGSTSKKADTRVMEEQPPASWDIDLGGEAEESCGENEGAREDDRWKLVSGHKRRAQAAQDSSRDPTFKFRNLEGCANYYLAVLALQKDIPGPKVGHRHNLKGVYILMSKNDYSTTRMCTLAMEQDPAAQLVMLFPAQRHVTGIFQQYPFDLPSEAMEDHGL